MKDLNYKGYKHIYTDGSKSEIGVGAAAITEGPAKSASLPKNASIFTAEAYAIHMTVNLIRTSKGKKFSVFTDSRSGGIRKHNVEVQMHESEQLKFRTT